MLMCWASSHYSPLLWNILFQHLLWEICYLFY